MGKKENTQWAVVWETDEGPAVLGPYDSEPEALDAAYEDWAGYCGGIAGGYDEGTRAEFDKMYAQTSKIWVVPMEGSDGKRDAVIVLPSGTELSVEAAVGDVARAREALIRAGSEAEASDLDHVAELLEFLAAS